MPEESLLQDSATVQRVEGQIKKLGLPLPKALATSGSEVEWPLNIATLSPEELAAHMTWWSGWASYIRYHYARVETNASATEKELRLLVAGLTIKMKGDYKTVTEMKAAQDVRPDVQLLEAKYLEADSMRRMLRALLEGYEGKFATISREITRRGSEMEGGSDGSDRFRVGGRP